MENKPNKAKNEPFKKIYRVSLTDVQAQAFKSLGIEINAVIQPKEGELDPSTIKDGDILIIDKYNSCPELIGELIVVDEIFERNYLSGDFRITAHLARDPKKSCRFWTTSVKLSRHV